MNTKNWDEQKLNGAAVWIQPGGHSDQVAKAMSHQQKQRLRKFIADGGGYVVFAPADFLLHRKCK